MRAIALTGLLLASPCAAADKAAPAVLSAGGFLGHWAVDCARPVSVDNRGVVVALNSTGDVLVDFTDGQVQSRYRIIRAEASSGGRYDLELIWLEDGRTLSGIYERQGNRFRVLRSAGADGHVFVEGGRTVPEGTVNPWLDRCGD